MTDSLGSDHSVDAVAHETGKTIRQIIETARVWISQRANGFPLSLAEKRQLRQQISREIGEKRVCFAWFSKRVDDYRVAVAQVHSRRDGGNYTTAQHRADLERLEKMRYSIESGLHDANALTLEQRGQVVQALDHVTRDPSTRVERIFSKLDPRSQATARRAAIASAQRVHTRQENLEATLHEQQRIADRRAARKARRERTAGTKPGRSAPSGGATTPGQGGAAAGQPTIAPAAQQPTREQRQPTTVAPAHESTEQRSPRQQRQQTRKRLTVTALQTYSAARALISPAEMSPEQIAAVQEIRATQVRASRQASGSPKERELDRKRCERAARRAAAVGLPDEQITWEINNAAHANSRCGVQVVAGSPNAPISTMEGFFPDEHEAAQWARGQVRSKEWSPSTRLSVNAYEAGHQEPFFSSRGAANDVVGQVENWHSEVKANWDQNRRQEIRQGRGGYQRRTTINPRRAAAARRTHGAARIGNTHSANPVVARSMSAGRRRR